MHGDAERAPRREDSGCGTSNASTEGGTEMVVLRIGPAGRTALPREGGLDSEAGFSVPGGPSKTSDGTFSGSGPLRI